MSRLSEFPGIGRRSLIVGAGGLLAAPSIVLAQQSAGVALVIGNSKYRWEASLPNAKRDSTDMAKCFQAMGLKTELLQDAHQGAMLEAIAKFKEAARGAAFAAFYFAGHGTQWNQQAYLVPIDADLSEPKTDGLVATGFVNKACNAAKANMRIFDNCRNNPADGWRQKQADDRSRVVGTYLEAFASESRNHLAIFSTAPGRAALDGPANQNSPFVTALLRELDAESVDITTLARKLRRDVSIASRGQQVVVDLSSYDRPFVLKGARLGRPASAGVDATSLIELGKTYAFAREKKILLPEGLVGLRSTGSAQLRQKVGSFKFTENSRQSGISDQLLVVLSADTEDTAQVLLAGPTHHGYWRFVKAKIDGEKLEFRAYDEPQAPTESFKWRDDNSGTMAMTWSGNAKIWNSPFARIDG
jgi:hypothetical protein